MERFALPLVQMEVQHVCRRRLTLLLAGRVTNQAESVTCLLGARNANRPETEEMCPR